MNSYHPDPEINAEVTAEANDNEAFDLSVGYAPSWWTCPDCSASHNRGHFGTIGNHRCLNCGYTGSDGMLSHNRPAKIEAFAAQLPR